jgi:hypothetical protein
MIMIKILKLVTGEEIIGQLTYGDTHIEAVRPCAVMLVASKSTPDQHSMALIPYAGYAKDHTITIDRTSVIWEADLEDSVYNQYQSIFGSGIEIYTQDAASPNNASLNIVRS